jgi:hypothetical protein
MRSALLGSPGVGTRYRTVLRIGGANAAAHLLNDVGATYAAVTANHHLDIQVYVPGFGLVTDVVVFDGTENTRAEFLAAILAQAKHFTAVVSGVNQLFFKTFLLGTLAAATVLNTSSADVLASLGLTGATPFVVGFGVRVLGAPKYGKSAVQYFGGTKPVVGGEDESANQHGVTVQAGVCPVLLIVDRNQPKTVSSDQVRFKPEPVPGAG